MNDGPPAARPPEAGFSAPEGFRAGFACVVGRPNTGKSTLTNAMVGRKVAIASARPETTRRVIRAVVNREDGQVVIVDTPGLHRPRTLLGERLNDMVRDSLAGVDAVVVCLPAHEAIGPGDRFLAQLVGGRAQTIAAVTKADLLGRAALAERLLEVSRFADFAEIVPVSAATGERVGRLTDLLVGRMPPGPPLYPRDAVTGETEETLIAELIREAALEDLQDELPHSLAVTVEEIDGATIRADLHVERDSQKGIVIGKGGRQLTRIGRTARKGIERLLGGHVYLDLRVKVAKNWQRDPKKMGRLGF